jgi:hypothetical protein
MRTVSISWHDAIAQGKGTIVSIMNGETVMLSVRNGKYYNLGETGGAIWRCIGTSSTVLEVVRAIAAEYNVEQDVCEEQVLSFLEQLLEHGLIDYDSRLA